MKKLLFILISLALISGCAVKEENKDETKPSQEVSLPSSKAFIEAKIIDVLEDGKLIIANNDETSNLGGLFILEDISDIFIVDEKGELTTSAYLKAGMLIKVGFGGFVMETWPAKPADLKSIVVYEKTPDIVGFYAKAIDDIYNEDVALNDGIKTLAFDFSGVKSLNANEKEGLIYMIWTKYGFETIQSSYDDLCENNFIDKDNLCFTEGLFFTIKEDLAKENEIKFSISKWRSGTGAIGYEGKAEYKNESWTYEKGSMWIS